MTGNRKTLDKPLKIKVSLKNQVFFEKTFDTYPIVLGRGSNCDIPLTKFEFISRQHAVITIENGQLQIVDLNSSNGIYFQGQKFKSAPIDTEVQVSIGELLVHICVVENFEDDTDISEKTSKIELGPEGHLRAAALPPTPPAEPIHAMPATEPEEFKPKQKESKIHKAADLFKKKEKPKNIPADFKVSEQQSVPSFKNIKAPPEEQRERAQRRSHAFLHNVHHEPKKPIINVQGIDQIEPHPQAGDLKPHHRVLEGYVTWKDTIYDVQQFFPGEKVTIGKGFRADLAVPLLPRNHRIAKYDGLSTECYIPNNTEVEIVKDSKKISMSELLASQALVTKRNGYILKLGNRELCTIRIADDVAIHFRYAPAPRQLSKREFIEGNEEFKKATIVSGLFHLMLALLAILNAPENHGPKIKGVQERYARLLVEPPRKIIEEKPKPKKKEEPKKVVEKKQPEKPKIVKKQQTVPKQVKLQKAVPVKNVAQLPVKKEVKVEAIGALAALTAISTSAPPTNQPVAININPNAGGMAGPKNPTGGVIGVLKTSGGKLAAGGGLSGVKTKGLGYGTGTGYGIQGVKGTAGTRAVAGTVVGVPQLMQTGKSEGLSKAQVMEVVKRYMGQIQQCYERSLFQNPGLAGRVQYEWEITAKGSVNWAKVSKSEIADGDALNSCVKAVFMKMSFPQAKNGQTTTPNIGFPFGRL